MLKSVMALDSNDQANSLEKSIYDEMSNFSKDLNLKLAALTGAMDALSDDEQTKAHDIAYRLMPLSCEVADICSSIEKLIPNKYWALPKYMDMLFLR